MLRSWLQRASEARSRPKILREPLSQGSGLIVMCPACQSTNNEVLETRATDKGRVDRRRHQCRGCRARWTSRAVVEPESVNTTGRVVVGRTNATRSAAKQKPPPTGSVTPPTGSVGGVGGGVSPITVSSTSVKSDTGPQSQCDLSLAGARTKPSAKDNGSFTRCRDYFVKEWEFAYGEKYPFEVKDGTTLAAMLKAHPSYGGPVLWESMVSRYLANEFWGSKRHPLNGLASKAREFAGPGTNGVPQRVQAGRDAAREWMANDKA